MSAAPETRASLLVRLRQPDDGAAWTQFTQVYAPLVYRFARRKGLQDADAADLTQEVLRSVCQAIRRFEYAPERGAFRGWFFTIVRRQLRDFLVRKNLGQIGAGDSATLALLANQPAPEESADWDDDYRERLLRWASQQVQTDVEPSTWQAFWQTSVLGRKAKEVAHELQLSVAAVYVARSRVLARLRDAMQTIEGEHIARS